MRQKRRRARSRRRGSVTVEAALLLPLALTLMLGTWEVGRMVEVSQILNSAVSEGGRNAVGGQYTNSQVQTIVLDYLQNAGLNISTATATISDLTNAGTDATLAKPLDQLQITVNIPFKAVRWTSLSLVTNSTTTLSATAIFYSNNNQSYPSSVSVPAGY
jgi:Flp pilus assembly protein TadG